MRLHALSPKLIHDEAALLEALNGRLVAIAGPPASGKSTLADRLAEALGSVVLPMDGFHYDDAVLKARDQLARKGAPETFDIDGFTSTLQRIKEGNEVAIPVFDRETEMSRAAARIVPACQAVIVEGNYLLLNRSKWRGLRSIFDQTVLIDVPSDVLRARLAARWVDHPKAAQKIEENDMPNAQIVRDHSQTPDIIFRPKI